MVPQARPSRCQEGRRHRHDIGREVEPSAQRPTARRGHDRARRGQEGEAAGQDGINEGGHPPEPETAIAPARQRRRVLCRGSFRFSSRSAFQDGHREAQCI